MDDIAHLNAEATIDLGKICEVFETTFPSDLSQPGFLVAGGITIQSIVLLLTGPFPPPDQRGDFSSGSIRKILDNQFGQFESRGHVPVCVFSTSLVSGETQWLTHFLNKNMYGGRSGSRLFATLGPFQEQTTKAELLLCAMILR